MSEKAILFVWRAEEVGEWWGKHKICAYCKTSLNVKDYDDAWQRSWSDSDCPLCGWGSHALTSNPAIDFNADCVRHEKMLRQFEISSTEVALAELGTHLKRNFSDVYALDPHRFEQIVADVFRENGFDAVGTQKTRDGGVDIFLVNRGSGVLEGLVECKRYARSRRVGIAAVQRLAGCAIEWNAKRAYFVTTSDFTRDSRRAADRIRHRSDLSIDLVAAYELGKLLGCYNEKLPPLHLLTPQVRKEIQEANRDDRL